MKNKIIIAALVCSTCLFAACGGDRSPRSGQGDTVKSTYGNQPDSSKVDTAAATGLDNSGSGGTKADSVKKDSAKK
ncbi:MAG: hypothetical protein ACXVJD_09450 [Mucilaginibacter sp.]